jgi:hypothetical protein
MHSNNFAAKAVLAATIVAGAGLFSSRAQAITFDVVQDFGNPVFSYTYDGGIALTPGHDATYTPAAVGGAYTNTGTVPNFAYIYQNVSGGPIAISGSTVSDPNNTLWLDPENLHDVTVTFTAAVAGTYDISGAFSGIDTTGNPHGVISTANGPIFTSTIAAGDNKSFSTSVLLGLGDVITFSVLGPGDNNSCGLNPPNICFLSTGLVATITLDNSSGGSTTPLPSAWVLLLSGVAGIGSFARRRTKQKALGGAA